MKTDFKIVAWLYEKKNGTVVALHAQKLDHTYPIQQQGNSKSIDYIKGRALIRLDSANAVFSTCIPIQEAWVAIAGNPQLQATKQDLFDVLLLQARDPVGEATKTAPYKIWLSVGDIPEDANFSELSDVSWSTMANSDHDVAFVRADIAQKHLIENMRLRDLLQKHGIKSKDDSK